MISKLYYLRANIYLLIIKWDYSENILNRGPRHIFLIFTGYSTMLHQSRCEIKNDVYFVSWGHYLCSRWMCPIQSSIPSCPFLIYFIPSNTYFSFLFLLNLFFLNLLFLFPIPSNLFFSFQYPIPLLCSISFSISIIPFYSTLFLPICSFPLVYSFPSFLSTLYSNTFLSTLFLYSLYFIPLFFLNLYSYSFSFFLNHWSEMYFKCTTPFRFHCYPTTTWFFFLFQNKLLWRNEIFVMSGYMKWVDGEWKDSLFKKGKPLYKKIFIKKKSWSPKRCLYRSTDLGCQIWLRRCYWFEGNRMGRKFYSNRMRMVELWWNWCIVWWIQGL